MHVVAVTTLPVDLTLALVPASTLTPARVERLAMGFPVAYRATDLLRGTPSGFEFLHRVFGV